MSGHVAHVGRASVSSSVAWLLFEPILNVVERQIGASRSACSSDNGVRERVDDHVAAEVDRSLIARP